LLPHVARSETGWQWLGRRPATAIKQRPATAIKQRPATAIRPTEGWVETVHSRRKRVAVLSRGSSVRITAGDRTILYSPDVLCNDTNVGQEQTAPSLVGALASKHLVSARIYETGVLAPSRDPWHCWPAFTGLRRESAEERRGRRSETRCCCSSWMGCSCCGPRSGRCSDCCSTTRHAPRGVSSGLPPRLRARTPITPWYSNCSL